jgi:hypothetical protein
LFLKSLERMISLQNIFNMTTVLSRNFLESNTGVCDYITTQVFCNLATQPGPYYPLGAIGSVPTTFLGPAKAWKGEK